MEQKPKKLFKTGKTEKIQEEGSITNSEDHSPEMKEVKERLTTHLHVHLSDEQISKFVGGYKRDEDFRQLITCTLEEPQDERKFCAYRISDNGLLYFEDADHNLRLCMPFTEQINLIKEVHNSAHKSAHAGWEHTLAVLQDRFYWPQMWQDVTEYIHTCDPCQKTKHS